MRGEEERGRGRYQTGEGRVAGATGGPTSHYRAGEVVDFCDEQGLHPEVLRVGGRHQMGLLSRLFDGLDLDPELIDRDRSVSLEDLGGFLALDSPRAGDIHRNLKNEGVSTDFRGQILRLGPAPYLSDRQLETAMVLLGQVVGLLRR